MLGVPAGVETQFIIEGAMNRVMEAALPECRRILQVLDSLEEQMVGDHELMAVSSLGEITVDPKEQEKLTRRYDYWAGALANLLGAMRNPFDKRIEARVGLNVRVI